MNVLYPFLLTLGAGLATGIGSAIAFVSRRTSRRFFSFTLGLSAGVMLYVSFVELFVESRELFAVAWGSRGGSIGVAVFFFVGMAFIGIIDKLVPSFENPHEMRSIETMDAAHRRKESHLHHLGIMTALAIAIHNVPEGIATFMAAESNLTVGIAIAVAIALHNIPEGIAVSVPLYYATQSRRKAFWYSFLSGMAEPVGALAGYLFLQPFWTPALNASLLAFVSGIMVYISFDELLPGTEKYGHHHYGVAGVILGMAIMAGSLLLL